jgi:hypothetical protein
LFSAISEHTPLILTELIEHKKHTTFDVGNPDPGLRQAQKCGRVKSVNEIPTLPYLMLQNGVDCIGLHI